MKKDLDRLVELGYLKIFKIDSEWDDTCFVHSNKNGMVRLFLISDHLTKILKVTLGNEDLPRIVNGFPGDTIEKRPFDVTFTQAKQMR